MTNPSPRAVSEMIRPANIKLHLVADNSETVLDELTCQIPEILNQPAARKTLLHALLERERLHSTGIGDGIALPHARNALVGLIDHPVIVFGRHATGIDYAAIDGVPARLFFLIVAPTVTDHLAILARLSRLLRQPNVRKNLLAAKTPDEVITVLKEAEARL